MRSASPVLRAIGADALEIVLLAAICAGLEFSHAARTGARTIASVTPGLLVVWAVASARWPAVAQTERVQRLATRAFVFTALLFIIALYGEWSRAISDDYRIGSILPYSDAVNYFSGANTLLDTHVLDEFNSRRPLNATLLAVRLALVGRHYRFALLLQAVVLAYAAYVAARAVARELGPPGGALVVAGVLMFSRPFLATAVSEPLGITFGCLALALLLSGSATGSAVHLFGGLAGLSLGLQARSGAMFCVPLVVAWSAFAFGPGWAERFRTSGAAVAGVAVAALTNALVGMVNGASGAGQHSYFSYILYGLAKGGVGWRSAARDNPQIQWMHAKDAEAFLYARSMNAIRSDPLALCRGLWRGLACFVQDLTFYQFDTGRLFPGHRWLSWVLVGSLTAATTLRVRRRLSSVIDGRTLSLLHSTLVGALLAVPIVFLDGRRRVFASVVPFLVAYLAVLVHATGVRGAVSGFYTVRPKSPSPAGPATLIAGLAILGLLGPGAAAAVYRSRPTHRASEVLCAELPGGGVVMNDWLPGLHVVATTSEAVHPDDVTVADITSLVPHELFAPSLDEELRSLAAGDALFVSSMQRDRSVVYLHVQSQHERGIASSHESCESVSLGGFWLVRSTR